MSQKKNTHSKPLKNVKNMTASKAAAKTIEPQDADEMIDTALPKSKRPIEPDVLEDVVPSADEKIEEDVSSTEDVDDSSGDEVSLDDDEINPFGDKWEQ